MSSRDQLFGADRVVAYLPAAVASLNDLDGSREQRIRTKIEGFLDSPQSVFDKHPRDNLGQIKDRNAKIRAFATWCQNPAINLEVCVIHDIYRKKNEARYWDKLDGFSDKADQFADKVAELDASNFSSWKQQLKQNDDILLVDG